MSIPVSLRKYTSPINIAITIALIGSISLPADARMRGYNNNYEIDAIKKKVRSGAQPWKLAYDKMLGNANGALGAKPQSVTFDSINRSKSFIPTNVKKNSNGSLTLGPRPDYLNALSMSESVRELALGYAFTGDKKYADKAIKLIKVWFTDPKTGMNPNWQSNFQNRIEEAVSLGEAFAGIDLILDYPGWKQEDKQAMLSWAKAYSKGLSSFMDKYANTSKPSGLNNIDTWTISMAANVAVVMDDKTFFNKVVKAWKNVAMTQANSAGLLTIELKRYDSLSYSTYALNSFVQVAEVARHNGIDLYNFRQKNGMTLEKIFDAHAMFGVNPGAWKYEQNKKINGNDFAIYELMNNAKPKASYQAVINKWKRPLNEIRVLGPISLTHAAGAYQWKIHDGEKTVSVPTRSAEAKKAMLPKNNSRVNKLDISIPTNSFRGIYYDTKDFTSPRFTRQDAEIDFRWGTGSPANNIGSDTFSVVWEGKFDLTPGTYEFISTSDDGIQILVNSSKVIDKRINQSATEHRGRIELKGNKMHNIKVRYFENSGSAMAKVSWKKVASSAIPPRAPKKLNNKNLVPVDIYLKGVPFDGDAAYVVSTNGSKHVGTVGASGKMVRLTAQKGDILKVQFTNNKWGGSSTRNRDMSIKAIKIDGRAIDMSNGNIDGNKWNRASKKLVHFSSGTNDEGGTYTINLP